MRAEHAPPPGAASLIIVNDRSLFDPVPGTAADGDEVACTTGSHGLDSALLSAAPATELYLGSARSPAQRRLAERGAFTALVGDERYPVRFVATPPEAYRKFYDRWANRLMWLLYHGLPPAGGLTETDVDAFRHGYRTVNRNLADGVLERLARGTGRRHVLWQDYQLSLAPGLVRAALAESGTAGPVVLQHFLHTPFPAPEHFAAVPPAIGREILLGLLGNDLIGFQTPEHAGNFAECCLRFLGAEVDPVDGVVRAPGGRPVRVHAYPIPPDRRHLAELLRSPAVAHRAAQLRRVAAGRKVLFSTGRIDPVKDLDGALLAFARHLETSDDPGSVAYFAHLQPARQSIPEWRELARRIVAIAADINLRFADLPARPVELALGEDIHRALAGYLEYDVLDVVPHADGMNLVSLEGPLVNRGSGVLLLSTAAGSHGLLHRWAVGVPPGNTAGHVRALRRALAMSPGERRRRADGLRAGITGAGPRAWLRRQLEDASRTVNGTECERDERR